MAPPSFQPTEARIASFGLPLDPVELATKFASALVAAVAVSIGVSAVAARVVGGPTPG
jgi:hypothetical protein